MSSRTARRRPWRIVWRDDLDWLGLIQDYWKPAVEIGVLWFVFYLLFVYIKDSGMIQALKGILFLVALFFLSQTFRLDGIRWILSHLFQISIIGFLIIFQPELRRGLARIGRSPLFKMFVKEERVANEIVRAVGMMSKNRIGALIALEREMSLKPYIESGIPLDGVLTSELLMTIFMPNTPFHDGGVIVQGNRVVAVGCLFPLSQSQKLSKVLGTRHRAGLGLSEESDAVVIVVSEETGIISLMVEGRITQDVDEEKLKELLFAPVEEKAKGRKGLFRKASA
jgi:diadenylate cyclase